MFQNNVGWTDGWTHPVIEMRECSGPVKLKTQIISRSKKEKNRKKRGGGKLERGVRAGKGLKCMAN